MSKEFELIYALCEALGFEVETTLDYQVRKETKESAMRFNRGDSNVDRVLACYSHNTLDIDKDGMYTSLLIKPIVSYSLEKVETAESEK